ncbi:Serine/threonine-protein phosphatase 2B catalytic subunit alpha [Perkinsus olseni]|uniref:Serine/threonine-protein phosphatase n=2 Tax=Perkinsus olseni TaxID=32597 RepID=A0A7J6LUA4_PEROL|nr:Serine/threonine-protein phosphatase 2B catalytic subunit alpha [Perkinsus olseni]
MEPLEDPLHDRRVDTVTPPPRAPLTPELLFPEGEESPPDWRCLRKHLFAEGRLYIESITRIVKAFINLCTAEPNIVKLKDPITVVGDIHGQYYDLIKLLEVGGDPSTTQYLFLGDYVDRGSYSVEVLLLLYALKINYPKTITLLRGNHECRQMTAFFNFRDECEYKYNLTVYELFMESFDSLPLAAVVNGKFLCIHGGLSPDLNSLADFNNINRFQEPPRQGLFCDILWSDPEEEKDGVTVFKSKERSFIPNDVRGCSFFYTYEAATKFLGKNSLLSVIRAHEAQLEGYKMHRTNEATGFPSVITIFSAPNYCDVYNNKGAVLRFENNTLNILQFNYSKHPYHLPNFMDVFAWSMPFVAEKITEMLFYVLNPQNESGDYARVPDVADEDLPQLPEADLEQLKVARLSSLSEEQNKSVSLAARLHQHMMAEGAKVIEQSREAEASGKAISKEKADRMRKKIQTVSRMMLMFKTLREENETIISLKGVCPGHRLAPGLLLSGRDALKNELEKFTEARSMDLENERMPTQKEVESQPHFHRGMSSS